MQSSIFPGHTAASGGRKRMVEGPTTVIAKTTMLVCSEIPRVLRKLGYCPTTSVKLSYELGKITFSTGKPKLTPGEVSTFQGF